jgi:hypothetical protein
MTRGFQAVFYGETSAESGESVKQIFTKTAEMETKKQEDGVDSRRRAPVQGTKREEGEKCR